MEKTRRMSSAKPKQKRLPLRCVPAAAGQSEVESSTISASTKKYSGSVSSSGCFGEPVVPQLQQAHSPRQRRHFHDNQDTIQFCHMCDFRGSRGSFRSPMCGECDGSRSDADSFNFVSTISPEISPADLRRDGSVWSEKNDGRSCRAGEYGGLT